MNAVERTQNGTGASLDSHEAEESIAINCNLIHVGKGKLEGNTCIGKNDIKMNPKGTIL